ncbi:MAG: Murein DD-endopeptidase MepM [Pseudomonadota bacterium]|jgi:murein DD-endopeptidase MepM/ murein hydrolase activator NlpD
MQLIWIGGPAHRIVSFSWTARRLWLGGLLIATVLLLMGGLMHFMGLRVAVDFAPELVRSMGGVASQSQLQKLEEQHALQLQSLQGRVQALQTQLQTLHTSQNQWLQGLGWKSNGTVSGDKPPAWSQSGGQGGPLQLLTAPKWRPADKLSAAQQALAQTEQAVDFLSQSWQAEQHKLALLPLSNPLSGDYGITSRFGHRSDPLTRAHALHTGLDLVAPRHARVSATAPGRVVRSELSGAYGQLVEIEHASHYLTRYAHLDRRDVAAGDVVQRGQAVGVLGNTGRSTGPHLHYEILYKNQAVNPETPLQALWQDRH